MTPYQNHDSAACKRLAEDMKIRNMATNTINAYAYHVSKFEQFLGSKPITQTTSEDVRNFQLHLMEVKKVGFSAFNQAVCGLRFLFSVTLPRQWPVTMIPFGKKAKTLPTVLSDQEVANLLQCTANLKHRTFFMTLYAGGLRLSEAANLMITDVDSQRMQLNIQSGKGRKQRQVPLSSAFAQGTQRLLEGVSHDYLVAAGQVPGQTLHRKFDSKSDQDCSQESQDHQDRDASHAATLLRNGIAGSRSGHSHHQPLAGARQFHHHDGIFTRATQSPATLAQPAGLAADSSTAQVARPDGQPAKLTVAQILKRNAGAYVQRYSRQAVPQVQSTLAKLSLCRTAALGGHLHLCTGCNHEVNVYNSCGDRHCPTCSGARRRDWLESARSLILDGVDHFQVVFTLPEQLSRLALGNRKQIYDLLFTSAWSALKQVIAQEHGFESAALMVLHTWNQKLDAHAHVHAVVPGCGPALQGAGIAYAQRGQDASTRGQYLVDAESLRAAYRQAF